MAKEKYDLNVDFDKELERELAKLDSAMGKAPNRKRKKREIVYDSFKDFGKGALSSYTPNSANIERMVRAAIPTSLTSEAYSVLGGYNKLKNTFSKEVRETKKLGRDAVKAIKSLFPENSRIGGLLGKAADKLSDGTEDSQLRRESALEQGLAQELENNFTKEATLTVLTQNMEEKRHSSMLQVLQAIHDNTTVLKNFSIEITNSFYRKSLELQYKSLFAMKENVAATKALAVQLKEQLENIVKNTAIPDAYKANNKDFLKSSIYTSIANRGKTFLYNNFGGKRLDEMMNKLGKRVEMTFSNIKMGLSSLIEGSSMIEMVAGMGDALGDFGGGLSKSNMAGSILGSLLGDAYLRQMSEKYAGSKMGREAIFKLRNTLADPVFAARSKKDKRIKAGKNQSFKDRSVNKLLDYFAGMGGSGSDYIGKVYEHVSNPDAPAMFNNKTQLAIVKIIPDLLSRIYAELKTTRVGGNAEDHEMVFDYNRQKLVNRSKFAENFKKDFTRFATSKIKDPMGKLVGGIGKFGGLTKDEKTSLSNYIITYLISYNPGVSLDALSSYEFLNILPPRLAVKVRKGVRGLMDYLRSNVHEHGIYVNVLNDIRNAIPHIEGRIDAAVSIGEADMVRRMGLLSRDVTENSFKIESDAAQKFIQTEWGNYDESWEPYDMSGETSAPRFKTIQERFRRGKRVAAVNAEKARRGVVAGLGFAQDKWNRRDELLAQAQAKGTEFFAIGQARAAEMGRLAREKFDEAKGYMTEAELKQKFKNSLQAIKAKAAGAKVSIDQWAASTGMYERYNIVKNQTQLKAIATKQGLKAIGGEISANGLMTTAKKYGQQGVDFAKDTGKKVKKAAKQKIAWQKVEAAYFESTAFLTGAVNNMEEWLEKTGLRDRFIIEYDKALDKVEKGKNKIKDTKDRAISMTKAKVDALEAAIKDDPIDKIKDDDERLNTLQEKFFNSEPYLSGAVTDFGDWCVSMGRDPITGKKSNLAKAKYDIIKRGGILSKAMLSRYGTFLTKVLRTTRKLDRKMAVGLTKGVVKGVKLAGKIATMPFRPGGLKAMWGGLKFGTKVAADALTQPWIQMFNAGREAMGKDPVFDGGFLGMGATKATRKAERAMFVKSKRALKNIRTGMAKVGEAVWGFLFRKETSLAEEAAKAGLSPDTQILAAGLDRISAKQTAAQEKENLAKKKERVGSWWSRLNLFGKKKTDKAETTKSKGILAWMKEHKTGLTLAGGFLLVSGILKSMGVTLDDVKGFVKGVWSGIQGIWGFLKSAFGVARDGLNWVSEKLGFKRKKTPVLGPDGQPLTDPNTGEIVYEDGDTAVTETVMSGGKMALGAAALGAIPVVGRPIRAAGRWVAGKMWGGTKALAKGTYNLGLNVVNKATGGAVAKEMAKDAAKAATKKTAKEAAELTARKAATETVEKVIAESAKGNIIDKAQGGLLSKVKGKAINIMTKLNMVWEAAKKKIKYIYKLITHPKRLKIFAKAMLKKAVAKIGLMLTAAATGIGIILTSAILIWDFLWILKYMLWDDMTFWEAVSQQILGVNVFDEKIKKQLEEAGITDEKIHGAMEEMALTGQTEKVLSSTTVKNNDGTFTTTKYILKTNGPAVTAFNNALKAKSVSVEDKKKYAHLAEAIMKGNVSPAEKAAVIQEIIKGRTVTIGGITFGMNRDQISPGLRNTLKGDFKNYGPKMKERIMSFAWDAFMKTGYPLQLNGPRSGMRTMADQQALYEQKGGKGVAKPSPESPHIMGYGIDMSSTHPNIGSSLHLLPGARELLEQNGLKLPLLNWPGYPESWHVEPAEARPNAGTLGERLTKDPYFRKMDFINQFTQGTGKGSIEAPTGEIDDIAGAALTKINKASGPLGGVSSDSMTQMKELASKASSANATAEDKKAYSEAQKQFYKDNKISYHDALAKQEGKETYVAPMAGGEGDDTIMFNPFKSVTKQTNSILSDQLVVQREMRDFLSAIANHLTSGNGLNNTIKKDSHNNPSESIALRSGEYPVNMARFENAAKDLYKGSSMSAVV